MTRQLPAALLVGNLELSSIQPLTGTKQLPALQDHVGSHRFQSNDDVKISVIWCLQLWDTNFYQEGTEKLIL
jgi:hypothetical protein